MSNIIKILSTDKNYIDTLTSNVRSLMKKDIMKNIFSFIEDHKYYIYISKPKSYCFPYIKINQKNNNIINILIPLNYETDYKEIKNFTIDELKKLTKYKIKNLEKKVNIKMKQFSTKEILINMLIQILYIIKKKYNIENYVSNVLFGLDKHIIMNNKNLSENLLRLEFGYNLRLTY